MACLQRFIQTLEHVCIYGVNMGRFIAERGFQLVQRCENGNTAYYLIEEAGTRRRVLFTCFFPHLTYHEPQ